MLQPLPGGHPPKRLFRREFKGCWVNKLTGLSNANGYVGTTEYSSTNEPFCSLFALVFDALVFELSNDN